MPIRGYTLLEMVIVTAIIASMVALSIPAMQASLGTSELRDAAKQVRAGLTKARWRAIETGAACQFRYQSGSGRFEVGPKPTLQAGSGLRFVSARAVVASAPMGSNPAGGRRAAADEAVPYELPAGVRFSGREFDDRNTPDLPSFDSASTARLDARQWSAPIVFYPNGRTSAARIRLIGGRDLYVDVTLRGVTGIAKIGDPMRKERPQ